MKQKMHQRKLAAKRFQLSEVVNYSPRSMREDHRAREGQARESFTSVGVTRPIDLKKKKFTVVKLRKRE